MNHRITIPIQGRLAAFALSACFLVPLGVLAQTGDTKGASTAQSEEKVVLSPFEVSASKVGSYQVSEATSGGRVAASLFDATNSISVVTNALMQDIGATDVLGATLLLAGVANSSQPYIDRLAIRGFQVNNPGTVDSFFLPATGCKMDPIEFDRIELIRGPNAILSPVGSPGGTMNLVTKIAQLSDFGSVMGEFGEYNTNRAGFDINRIVKKNVAFRLVAGYEDYTQGDNQGYRESVTVLPSIVWYIGRSSKLVVEYTYRWAYQFNGLGFPIDPSTGTNTGFSMLHGMDIRQKGYADNINDPTAKLHDNTQNYNALFTSVLNDNLSMRLAARYFTGWETYDQWNLLGNTGGAYNPLTGFWTPGFTYGAAPTFTATPAAATTSIYSVSQSPGNVLNHYLDLQHDYVYQWKTDSFKSETTGGLAAEAYRITLEGWGATSAPINILAIPNPAIWTGPFALMSDTYSRGTFEQVYLNENFRFWNDRITINAGGAQTWYRETVYDYLRKLTYSTQPHPLLRNYGLNFQPVHNVSFYYGHAENAVQLDNPPTTTGVNPDLQASKQDEEGVRFRFLNDRATLTVDYFDLAQTNNTVINPATFSNPPPTITPPPLVLDRVARGWEYELNMSVTDSLSVIANATNFRNRTPLNQPYRGTSECSGAGWLYYTFKQGTFKGLALGVSYSYQGKRPGDTASGAAAGSTTTNVIPNEPSFYVPAYGLVNISLAYRHDNWALRFFVDNVLNKTYYAEALNRNAVYPGIPINPYGSITYSF